MKHLHSHGPLERARFALDVLGLRPFGVRLRETMLALKGDTTTPPSRFDRTSLRILAPGLAARMWLGRRRADRRVPIYNLFNRTPTEEHLGWSVRKTQVRDFRGGTLTYDSHNGTDFATPPGTVVVAPAPARVALVVSEYNRGGLKLMLDHGAGLTTVMAHLARALVREGDVVPRGAPVALSGASGLNFVAALGLDPPHLHFNTWLDGVPVDPFAIPGEVPLWRSNDNEPVPDRARPRPADGADDAPPPSDFDAAAVDAWIAACRHPALRDRLAAIPDLDTRACHTIFFANYYPTRFDRRVNPYRARSERRPLLDLPFGAEDYLGIAWP